MTSDRAGKMAGIKEQIERGQYRIDPGRVAEAIIRRLGPRLDGSDAYNRCSYPDSSASKSPNRTPPVP